MIRIAIIKSGFMRIYFEQLVTACNQKGISYEIFDDYKEINNQNGYEYIIVDKDRNKYKEGCCFISHTHSHIYRIKDRNILYRAIYHLSRRNKIKKHQKIFQTAKKIFVVSNVAKQDYIKNYGIDENKIYVIHPGFVKQKNNDLIPVAKFNYGREFNVAASATGFVSKGGYVILKALRIFKKLYPAIPIRFNIIYPKYKSNFGVNFYVNLFGLSKYVNFLEYQSDMNAFYCDADCVVCASLTEAFGRVVTEAMYAKRPVIISSNIGASEIIKDGENGFIFQADKNSSYNLAIKIKEVYDKYNSLDDVINRAYETAKRLDWENFALELVNGLTD